MTAQQLATLLLRLLGLYCLLQTFSLLGTTILLAVSTSGRSMAGEVLTLLLVGLPVLGTLLLGLGLLVGARRLGRYFVCGADDAVATVSFEQVQTLAFAVVGLLIFAESLPNLWNAAYVLALALLDSQDQMRIPAPHRFAEWGRAAGTLLQAALGLTLFFGARGFANFWRTLRTAGTPPPSQTKG